MMQVPELLKPVEREAQQPSTPPSKVSMLATAARSFAQDEGQDFVHSMETVATINPDAYAKATAVSRYSGIPAKVLHDNTDRMNQLLRGNEYADIYGRYRKTANALRDGNTAAITQDDVDQLTRIEGAAGDARFNQQSTGEKLFGAIRQQWVAMRQSTDVSLTLKHQDELARFDEIDAAEAAGAVPMATREQREQMGVYGLQYLNAPPEQRAELRNFIVQGQVDRLASASADEKTLAAMPIDPGARRAAELEASGQSSLASTAEALAENPGYAVRTAVGAAATSAPMLAAGAIGGPLAAAPIAFGMEYDAKLADVLREAGVDFNDPKAVMRALQDDALIEEGRRKAGLKAAGTTAVDMISMGLASKLLVPGQIAGRTLSTTQRELANLAVQFPVQGITEGAGEAAGQLLAEGEVDAGEVLLETVAGAGMSSVDVLAFSNRRFIEYLGDGLRTARQTKAGAESLGEMVDASMSSKTRKRDRETFREVAAQQLQDSPMETLWLPAEALQRLNQSSQVNLPALLQEVPGLAEQFADAAARGGSVSLKTSDYLAVFADYHDQLAGSVRINVDGMSVDDAQAWNSEVETQLDQLAEQMRMPPDTAAEVRTQMVGELVASGYRRADAEQYAATHLSVMQNLADRTGIALEQLREQYQLDIGAKAPEQLRAVTVDDARIAIQRLRAGDIPNPADMFGQSLREYLVSTGGLNDEGGELAAIDADVGSVGRNRITRAAGGRSLDEAAMDAWERGYFPGVAREDVGAQLIVDGIQRELAGTPVYSTEQENATLRTQADTLNQLQEYLDRLGVDIADMSDDEVLAMLQGQGEQVEGRRLDQFAGPSALTANQQALVDAQQRIADGDDAEQVRKDTGWFKGADGKWRFEIADGDARLLPGMDRIRNSMRDGEQITSISYREGGGLWVVRVVTDEMQTPGEIMEITTTDVDGLRPILGADVVERIKSGEGEPDITRDEDRDKYLTPESATFRAPGGRWATVGEILDHQRLFEAYPQLAGMRVVYAPEKLPSKVAGAIAVDMRNGEPVMLLGDVSDRELRKTVLHELQHGIQKIEGFASGGSSDRLENSPDYREQVQGDAQAFREQQWAEQYPEAAALRGVQLDLLDQLTQEFGDPYSGEAVASPLYAEFEQAVEAAMLADGADAFPVESLDNLLSVELYNRLAGEVEARNVEARADFSDAVAAVVPPQRTADTADADALVTWDGEEMRSEAVEQAVQLNQGEDDARGFITFQPRTKAGEQRRFQITLGEKRDLTTLLHELGHYYLEVLDDVADGENAPEQITRDMATMRAWMGAEEGKPLTTEQHEQFARGFEKYLAEGKAPNPELAGAFARFKRWLIGVYKDLTRLNVELTDDVRRVFDRLVATDEQIVAAEQVSNAIPLFADAQAAGMSEAEYAAYQDSIAIAHADAQESVEREVQREEELRRSKWWREESAKVRREVVEEVDTVREYAALRALRTGNMPDGTTLPLKLNSGELVERYGASTARRLAFTQSKTGQPLDVASPMLGYESGDQMIKAMLGATPRSQLIEQEVQQRMLERHGPKSTGEAAERALDAVHNERRADVLTKELQALGKQGNRKNITSQQILKEAARRIMAERKVRDIQPAEYQRAEAKAGREAFEAMTRGNVEAAYEAKQRQMMNFYLYREARKARENVDTIVNRLAKYNKRSKREQLGKAGESYLDQIDTVMEQYEFRTVSLRELDKRVTFQAWYADQLARGNEPYVPEFVLNNSERINYKELSLSELQELDEFVANVNHLAKTKNRLLANKRIRDFDEARTELIRAGYGNLAKRKKPPIDKNTRTMLEKIGDGASEFSAALIKMEQVVDWLDDGQVDGPWSTTFWQPFVEAQAEKERLNREFAIKMTTLVDAYTAERGAKVMRQQTYIASLGQSLTHNAILSAALNTGNASNRKKLLDGGHNGKAWTEQQLAEITGNMNATDWAFVQSMWDLVEELWPSIEQLEKDLHGIPPAKVEAIPVVTQFGEFRGGYWPLVYDTSAAAYAGVQNQLGNEGGLFEQGYARATTPKGHTKARVDSFAAPILLDVEIIAQHLGQVIHDLTHRKAIRDGAKIVGDKQIKQMLIDTLGVNVANQFNPWLQGVANDMVLDSQKGIDAWTRGAERLRANLAIGWMGFSATTGLQQILGYSQTFEFFSKIGAKRYIFQGMQEFIRAPFKAIEFVNGLSPEMRYRVDNLDRDMRGVLKRIAGKGDTLSVVQRLAFKHIAVIQALVDYPTWIAGYRHGLDSGLTADDAVAAGDRAVRLSQMAAGPKDLAAIQRKDGLMRALTIVYSYFNLLYNRQVDIGKAFRTAKGMADYLNAFERTMFLIAIPAIAGPMVTGNGPGDDEDWRAWASLKILTYPLLAIPGVRDLASGIESGWGYKGATPLGELFVTLNKLATVGTKAAQGEEQDLERVTVLGIEAAGYGFGLPVAQPKRTVKYLFGVAEGDIEPEGVTDWMRGLLFGPPKE